MFEWDTAKAEANLKKHGVSFEEAETAFEDANALLSADYVDSSRTLMIAFAISGSRLLAIIFTEVATDLLRIISARPATRAERKLYEENPK